MEDGLKDNADKGAAYGSTEKAEASQTPPQKQDVERRAKEADCEAEISKAGFIFLGVMNFGLILIGTAFLIAMAKICLDFDCIILVIAIPYYLIAGILFFITGIFSILVATQKLYALLITVLVFSVLSIIACIPPFFFLVVSIPNIKVGSLGDWMLLGLLLTSFVEVIVVIVVCVKASQHIHYWRKK